MEDLDEIRRKKLEEIQKKLEEKRRLEEIKRAYLEKIMTKEARERLYRVKMVRPELAEYVENLIITWYRMGKITRITDDVLKKILENLYRSTKRETKIIIKRK